MMTVYRHRLRFKIKKLLLKQDGQIPINQEKKKSHLQHFSIVLQTLSQPRVNVSMLLLSVKGGRVGALGCLECFFPSGVDNLTIRQSHKYKASHKCLLPSANEMHPHGLEMTSSQVSSRPPPAFTQCTGGRRGSTPARKPSLVHRRGSEPQPTSSRRASEVLGKHRRLAAQTNPLEYISRFDSSLPVPSQEPLPCGCEATAAAPTAKLNFQSDRPGGPPHRSPTASVSPPTAVDPSGEEAGNCLVLI